MFRVITKKNILAYDSFRWLSLTLTEPLTRWLTGWHAYRCFAQSVLLWCMLYALRGRLIKLHGTCNCFVSNLFGVRNIWEFHASHRTVNVSALWSGIKISRVNECEVRVCVSTRHIARMGSDEFCRYNLHTKIQLNFVPCFIENLNNHIHTYYTF